MHAYRCAEGMAPMAPGWYRHHLLVLSGSVKALHEAIRSVRDGFEAVEGVEVSIDVDPMGML